MPHRLIFALVGLMAALVARPARAQFDEEGDLIPGLVGRYRAGERTIERIDDDLSHNWAAAAPDPRLPEGTFTAEWSSGLLLREEAVYTFRSYLQGAVRVEIDGETVLDAERDAPGWVTGEPVELSFGLLDLKVHYRKTADAARMQLFWSSDQFPLEPIPPHQIFREEGSPALALVETGRKLFAAHRCNRCHVREGDPPARPAPGLLHVTSGLNRDWLTAKLLDTNPEAAHAKMPSFGFSEGEAAAIAAWVEAVAQPARLTSTPNPQRAKGEDAPSVEHAARVLLHSVGCLACHKIGELGESGPFGGGDLSQIGAKRSRDWINTWLSNPERLNAQHRMPVFKLTSNERALLAMELSKAGRKGESFEERQRSSNRETDLIEHGRQLATAARCAACHEIPDGASASRVSSDASGARSSRTGDSERQGADAARSPRAGVPSLAQPVADWNQSCIGEKADRRSNRPLYRRIDTQAVKAYVNSRTGRLSPPGPFARGRSVLEERNCLGCHERGLTKGLVETAGKVAATIDGLRGQSQALIPPALTAVGDKLYEEPLARAVSGQQKETRLPWLEVRMPQFVHDDDEQRSLVAYLIDHDRIPGDVPAASGGRVSPDASAARSEGNGDLESQASDVLRSPEAVAQMLVTGRTLAGSGGFNCVACHKFGEYEPRNVALGTKGSDLKQIDQRMRAEFFYRWTRDPLRVVPGSEMPSIKSPVQGILEGDLRLQLAAVWSAINDPDFTAPPNPAQVEQHLVLQRGDAPRILRDVFTVSESNGGGYVPRAIAIGFDNGHSLLFDVDNFAVRGWTFGDFAQQRTEGKSWYWDLAGVNPLDGFDRQPDVALLGQRSHGVDPPPVVLPKSSQLLSYVNDAESVRVRTLLTFALPEGEHDVLAVQAFRPWSDDRIGASGIVRTIGLDNVPDGYVTQLSVDRLQGPSAQIIFGEAVAEDESLAVLSGDPRWSHHVIYASRLKHPPLLPKPRPEFPRNDAPVTTLPGFVGQRLKLPSSIMPTAIGWMRASGGRESSDASSARSGVESDARDRRIDARRAPQLVFTSLKGHVYVARDADGDGFEDTLTTFEEGLAAPFGLLADGDALLVAHKPELLRLRDTDGDGRADERTVVADGWGYTDNYHDWTTGPVRDRAGNIYLALGSDYQQPERPAERSRWRGKVLKVNPAKPRAERIEPFAHELRFPQGIALDSQDRLFVTDQQGVANTFNEIDHIVAGRHYGVEAMHEEQRGAPQTRPAVQVPHPWTRSVNGLLFLPANLEGPLAPFAGHGIGCEYNSKFLIRVSLQEVGGELQGATYSFTRPTWEDEATTFLGPMSIALSEAGDLYVGSMHDSGWLGGQNTGEIVRLSATGDDLPNGIRELRSTPDGFEIEFLRRVDAARARDPASYSLSGYTRVWEGSYATPDSGRYTPQIRSVSLSEDATTVLLSVDELRETYVYELNCGKLGDSLFPETGYYTMNRIPK